MPESRHPPPHPTPANVNVNANTATMPTPPALSPFGWLPPGTRAGAWRRLRLVWLGALLIALVLWGVDPTHHP
ncbi:MAG: hypothetical protein RJA09_725, partial [Pseudomonadota bacterium]